MSDQRSKTEAEPTTKTLPPRGEDQDETRWDDPWGAAQEARSEFLTDLHAATRITNEIERDPRAVAKLTKARKDAREPGKRMPRPIDTSSS